MMVTLCGDCYRKSRKPELTAEDFKTVLNDRDLLVHTVECMKKNGGSFASCIGDAMLHADSVNLKRTVDAFPDLVEKYNPKHWG